MLVSPLTFYDTQMRGGMNERLAILSSLNGRKRAQLSSCCDDSLCMTPSMSSVLTQIKRHSACSSASMETRLDEDVNPFQFDHWLSRMKRADSEESETTTMTSSSSSVDSHPLLGDDWPAVREPAVPVMKAFNLADLDFTSQYEASDLVQLLPPVYDRRQERKKRRERMQERMQEQMQEQMQDQVIPKYNKPMIYECDKVELEHWPLSKEPTRQPELSSNLVLADKRSRQQTLNPNFLKLYSIEMSSKAKKLLPDINVDDSILNHLTIEEIKGLDIHSNDEPLSPSDIKLALITRKKLWSNMTHLQRQDLYGEASPWNLRFVIKEHQHTDGKESSLVRVKSDVKPWVGDSSLLKNNTMLKPCGKIKLGSNPSAAEIQYVVKGWCDSRFIS